MLFAFQRTEDDFGVVDGVGLLLGRGDVGADVGNLEDFGDVVEMRRKLRDSLKTENE